MLPMYLTLSYTLYIIVNFSKKLVKEAQLLSFHFNKMGKLINSKVKYVTQSNMSSKWRNHGFNLANLAPEPAFCDMLPL